MHKMNKMNNKSVKFLFVSQYSPIECEVIRQVAEFDNYRKRVIKEKAELIKSGGEKLMVALLPVLDDFERAQESISNANDVEALKEGVGLRGYAQSNPLQVYALEGFQMFDNMLATISEEISRFLLNAEVRQNTEREEVAKNIIDYSALKHDLIGIIDDSAMEIIESFEDCYTLSNKYRNLTEKQQALWCADVLEEVVRLLREEGK